MRLRAPISIMLVTTLASFSGKSFADDKTFHWWEDGRGLIDSQITVVDPIPLDPKVPKCVVAKGSRFDMAPDPESSASSPTRLIILPMGPAAAASGAASGSTPACKSDYAYRARLQDLDSRSFYLESVIGAAVIPFKYYTGGDKGVKSNTAAIGYVGMKRHTPGGDYIIGIGAGPSQISTGSNTSSTSGSGSTTASSSDSTQMGFSYGIVLLGQLKYDAPAQFGIAIGQDRVSKSVGWQNNGKWWIGFQIGTAIF